MAWNRLRIKWSNFWRLQIKMNRLTRITPGWHLDPRLWWFHTRVLICLLTLLTKIISGFLQAKRLHELKSLLGPALFIRLIQADFFIGQCYRGINQSRSNPASHHHVSTRNYKRSKSRLYSVGTYTLRCVRNLRLWVPSLSLDTVT